MDTSNEFLSIHKMYSALTHPSIEEPHSPSILQTQKEKKIYYNKAKQTTRITVMSGKEIVSKDAYLWQVLEKRNKTLGLPGI